MQNLEPFPRISPFVTGDFVTNVTNERRTNGQMDGQIDVRAKAERRVNVP